MSSRIQKDFYARGLKFECQGSGKCCISRGEYGFVFLTEDDRENMAQKLGLSTTAFTKKYCKKSDGAWRLRDNKKGPECVFLNSKKQCSVYKSRPTQCRTWPFWPENMNAKSWSSEVSPFCPGVGKGKGVSASQIEVQLVDQLKAESELFSPDEFESYFLD